ncbi:MAG: CheB methylesterase domain-containing protein [Planctomycetota bacterium]|nr:CheB methylesterase domain-containing protein [Planctomycetota bacterium]MDA1143062.1 CheB methylesterase domain-containing protein [Planctomycetota bacterium]
MDKILILGASSGGPPALLELIPKLPESFPYPILIVQHMPPGFTGPMAEFLDEQSAVRVLEARQFDVLEPGKALVAPAPFHMYVEKGNAPHVMLSHEPVDSVCSPRIDCTMSSAASLYGAGVIGVVLSGLSAGNDCVKGAEAIRAAGGRVFTQARKGCACYFMPKAVVDAGYSDAEVCLEQLHERILAAMGVSR